jgi:hypothetical protein
MPAVVADRTREIEPGRPDHLLEFSVQFQLKGTLSNAEVSSLSLSWNGNAQLAI